ncbi:hypothetical protein [Paenibacillus thiaminolyticus]|uniref:Uncharacterized protein n=1 Tax=Paenibacillus thiaminolyticus TaxID=49283 RepID=A0A3A3GC74_PANTH|nr:hypothetical protein [Paenibacillus thiaminolyticus]RJG20620.1 hypothetical protein DQX05_24555 [Paenibacillus thiaminolyticus]
MNFLLPFSMLLVLHLKIRIAGQFSLLLSTAFKFLNRWSRTKAYLLFLTIKFVLSFFFIWALWNFVYNEQYAFYWSASIFLFFLFYPAIVGMSAWRRTHMPVYEELLLSSPRSESFIFGLLVAEEFIWSLINNIGLYTTMFALLILIHGLTFIEAVTGVFFLLCLSFLLFIISNRLFGRYIIYKICKPVGWIRFLFYILFSLICFEAGFLLIRWVLPYIRAFRMHITSLQALNSEEIWNHLLTSVAAEWSTGMNRLLNIVYDSKLPHVYLHEQFQSPNLLHLLALCVGCSILIPTICKLFPYKYNQLKRIEHTDFLSFYTSLLHYFNNLVYRKDYMVEREITMMGRNREHLASGLFSLALVETEIFFYSGIAVGLVLSLQNVGFIVSVICIFTMLAVANHVSGIRSEYPFLFLLSAEGKNVNLIRLSGNSIRLLFEAKMKLMRCMMIVPGLIIFIINCVLCALQGFTVSSSLFLIILSVSYWALPFFELYSTPFISKFNFKSIQEIGKTKEELELRALVDTAPRRFIIMPLMLVLYFGAFIIPSKISDFLPFFIAVYFTIVSLALMLMAKKITARGLKEIDKRVWLET